MKPSDIFYILTILSAIAMLAFGIHDTRYLIRLDNREWHCTVPQNHNGREVCNTWERIIK